MLAMWALGSDTPTVQLASWGWMAVPVPPLLDTLDSNAWTYAQSSSMAIRETSRASPVFFGV